METNRETHKFEVQIFTYDLDPRSLRVELYADAANGAATVRQEMKRLRQAADTGKGSVYGAEVPSGRQAADFTVRVVPYFIGAAVPLEADQILWQH